MKYLKLFEKINLEDAKIKFFNLVSALNEIYKNIEGFHLDGDDEKEEDLDYDQTFRIAYCISERRKKFPRQILFQLELCLYHPKEFKIVFMKNELNPRQPKKDDIAVILEEKIATIAYTKIDLANGKDYHIRTEKIDEIIHFIKTDLLTYVDAKI